MISLINSYGISKSRILVSLMMFCHWKLKLYLLYVRVNYSKFYRCITSLNSLKLVHQVNLIFTKRSKISSSERVDNLIVALANKAINNLRSVHAAASCIEKTWV